MRSVATDAGVRLSHHVCANAMKKSCSSDMVAESTSLRAVAADGDAAAVALAVAR